MDPALFVIRVLPPPPPRAEVLTRLDRPRARRTADRRIPRIMKPVIRDLIFLDVVPQRLRAPIRERIDLKNLSVRFIRLYFLDLGARFRLFTAKARDPRVCPFERALQGLHFPDPAALFPILHRLPKRVL